MKEETKVDILNKLIQINDDRIECYGIAIEQARDSDLKELFYKLSNTSVKCNEDLMGEVNRLGGQAIQRKNSENFFRKWIHIKTSLKMNDRSAVLGSCEFGEAVAIATYANFLKNNVEELETDLMSLLILQYYQIKADHDELKLVKQLANLERCDSLVMAAT